MSVLEYLAMPVIAAGIAINLAMPALSSAAEVAHPAERDRLFLLAGSKSGSLADLPRGEDEGSVMIDGSALELVEPFGGGAGQIFVLAATFRTAEEEQCLSLSIDVSISASSILQSEHNETPCVSAKGRWKQIAIVAQSNYLSKVVRYRLSAKGKVELLKADILAGPSGANLRALRTRVSEKTIAALDDAIKEVRARAMYASKVDWPLASAQAAALVVDGVTRRDALPGVQLILKSLGDNHSWATVLDEQGRLTANGKLIPYAAPTSSVEPLGGKQIGLLHIPYLAAIAGAEAAHYSDAILDGIEQAKENSACGIIVDLTGHSGGNMWPGLDGLGPLLGDGVEVGSFKPGPAWQVNSKPASEDPKAVRRVSLWAPELARLPVAVLLGPTTASSGEALAVAFSGRPNTEFFGRKTRGLASSNQMFNLGDGMVAFIVVAAMADRTGRTFPTGIQPNVEDDTDEAALARAKAWLSKTSVCAD